MDVTRNLAEIERVVESARAAGSSLVVFPEAVMFQFTEPAETIAAAAQQHSAVFEAALQAYAERYRVAIVAGLYLSDRFGRKPVLLGALVLSIVTLIPGYMLAGQGSLAAAILGQGMIAIAGGLFWGPLPIALLELFPTRVRLSCASISVNAAYALFGGTAPFLSTYLLALTHNRLAPAYYAVGIFLVAFFFIVRIPETYRRPLLQEGDLS